MEIALIPISDIEVGKHTQRERPDEQIADLARSISEVGLINPLTVQKSTDGKFFLVAGHRRLEAVKRCGFSQVSCNVLNSDESPPSEVAVAENLVRKDLEPLEEARLVVLCLDKNQGDFEKTSQILHRSRSWIQDRADLLVYPEGLQHAIQDGLISRGVAKELVLIDDLDEMTRLLHYAIDGGCTQRMANAWRRAWMSTRHQVNTSTIDVKPGGPSQPYEEPWLPCMLCKQPTKITDLILTRLCATCVDALQKAQLTQPKA